MEVYEVALARVGEVSPDVNEIDAMVKTEESQKMLSWRLSIAAPPSASELQDYQARVEDDRSYVRRKFFPERQRRVKHAGWPWRNPMADALRAQVKDVAPNDTGLPSACVSPAATALEAWCKHASWGLCSQCGSVQPQHLKESASRTLPRAVINKCKNCSKAAASRTWVPCPEEVPVPLRALSHEVVLALRPLDVDSGPEWKADFGYYFHGAMLRLSWSENDVEDKLSHLDPEQRRTAQEAGGSLWKLYRHNFSIYVYSVFKWP